MKTATIFQRLTVMLILAMLPLCGWSRMIWGDINMDGHYDVDDVVLVIHRVLDGPDPFINDVACDINLDGIVDVSDVSLLISYILHDRLVPQNPELSIPEGSVTYTVGGVSFQMVPVEGGTFMMGSTNSRFSQPVHQVTVSSFSIGLTEVTVGLWKAVMGSFHMDMYDDDQPAGYVTWEQCQEFIARLNEMTGQNFKLPTEAQWEFAARGGNLSQGYTYSGSNNFDEVGWDGWNGWLAHAVGEGGSGGYRLLSCVGTKKPNELGLYDMSGSVMELCQDNWMDNYESEPQVDPVCEVPNVKEVVGRGGSFMTASVYCAVYSRESVSSSSIDTYKLTGLRLAM